MRLRFLLLSCSFFFGSFFSGKSILPTTVGPASLVRLTEIKSTFLGSFLGSSFFGSSFLGFSVFAAGAGFVLGAGFASCFLELVGLASFFSFSFFFFSGRVRVSISERSIFPITFNPEPPSSFDLGSSLIIFGALSSVRSEEHTSELQSRPHLVCRLL